MFTLLDERFYPITGQYGFVQASLDVVVQGCEADLVRKKAWERPEAECEVREVSGSLSEMLSEFEESVGLMGSTTAMLVIDCGEWIACFENSVEAHQTWLRRAPRDVAATSVTVASSFAKEHRDELPFPWSSPETGRGGMVLFHLDTPVGTAGDWSWRVLCSEYTGVQWQWSESGEPLPCEDTSRYDRDVIRERLTSVMVGEYCRELGIRPFDDDFFGPRGVIVQRPVLEGEQRRRGGMCAEFQSRIQDFVIGEASSYVEA